MRETSDIHGNDLVVSGTAEILVALSLVAAVYHGPVAVCEVSVVHRVVHNYISAPIDGDAAGIQVGHPPRLHVPPQPDAKGAVGGYWDGISSYDAGDSDRRYRESDLECAGGIFAVMFISGPSLSHVVPLGRRGVRKRQRDGHHAHGIVGTRLVLVGDDEIYHRRIVGVAVAVARCRRRPRHRPRDAVGVVGSEPDGKTMIPSRIESLQFRPGPTESPRPEQRGHVRVGRRSFAGDEIPILRDEAPPSDDRDGDFEADEIGEHCCCDTCIVTLI
mmetsp:Transcript_12513/g.36937  ORF Transcript_12513/g.36937 Transcript_12513/m.36937 type:complete len:274 (-) Transcript_12513:94-915(-)